MDILDIEGKVKEAMHNPPGSGDSTQLIIELFHILTRQLDNQNKLLMELIRRNLEPSPIQEPDGSLDINSILGILNQLKETPQPTPFDPNTGQPQQ